MGIFLGDASGHGLAPALVISQTRTLIRSLSEINCDPYWVLNRVNQRLSNDLEPGRFVTAFLACLAADGQLHWCSAGHGPMFLRPRPDAPLTTTRPIDLPGCAVLTICAGQVTRLWTYWNESALRDGPSIPHPPADF